MRATQTEKIINNCLRHFPDTSPFTFKEIILKVGDKAAYLGTKYPLSNEKHNTENAEMIEDYMTAKDFAEPYKNQFRLTNKGRKLQEIGEINEFERRAWWADNIAILVSLASLIISFVALVKSASS